jgi:Helicase conserved C-terminal domain
VASSLTRWLGSLPAERLADLLANRPETLAPPEPADLAELAHRLQSRVGVAGALQQMPLPAVQVIETAHAFDCRDRAGVAAVLGVRAPELDGVLATLAGCALAWEQAGALHLSAPLRDGLRHPLRLGPGVAALLDRRTATELRAIGSALCLPNRGRKQEILADIRTALGDAEVVRALVATAPAATRKVLEAAAWRGPSVPVRMLPLPPEVDWAARRGLLVTDGWQHTVMPREVALALRGDGWRPPFTPDPPRLRLAEVEPAAVEHEAAAAAAAAVDSVGALLAALARTPLVPRKAGGVGAREQRRLAKAIGGAEAEVRLWLELAYTAGLLAPGVGEHAGQVLPTPAYDEWRTGDPADRLVPLLAAWWLLPAVPLRGDAVPLLREPAGRLGGELRHRLLQSVAAIPAGGRIADETELGTVLHWRLPLLIEAFAEPAEYIGPLWSEARLLGVVAHGAATDLAAALAAGDPEALRCAAGKLLDRAVPEAIFQADLTAVVPGIPAGPLAELLDSVADRESRGTASTWRFTAASVRRALDAGERADELAEALRTISVGGGLPQALEYLLRDVARGHGRIRVRPVGCVLRADDPALLAEVAATRSLSRLGLSVLAPTVLGSTAAPAETLAALRAAGYAPVGEDTGGAPRLERLPGRRAVPSGPPGRSARSGRPAPAAPRRSDPLALATALLAGAAGDGPGRSGARAPEQPELGADEPEPAAAPAGTLASVAAHADQLNPAAQRLLAYAIDHRGPVEIHYTNAQGGHSIRVIEEIELLGGAVEAWCRLRGDERMFMLDRIEAVAPA